MEYLYRDFASDVNLCIEIWGTDGLNLFGSDGDFMMLIIAWGSLGFVVIPYIANLVIAARIQKLIKTNEAAKAWYVSIIIE